MTNKIFKSIIIIEIISLVGFFVPIVRELGMAILLPAIFYLIYKHNQYAIYLAAAELIIGSKGHLLFIELHGQKISLRIALWLVILLVWFLKAMIDLKNKNFAQLHYFRDSKYFKYFFLIFLFSIWGVVSGYLHHNKLANLINDFNAWLYFLLIFPFYYFGKDINKEDLKDVAMVAIMWSSIKTLFLLFLFSHDSGLIAQKIYRWVRVTGVGEITRMQFGFFRIFFQSHVYQVITFFPIVFYLSSFSDFKEKFSKIKNIFKNFDYLKIILFTSLLWAITILSLSRSNWLGLAFGLFLVGILFLLQKKFNELINITAILLISLLLGALLILAVISFPIPRQSGDFNLLKSLSDRLTETEGESAISSRWELLPALWKEIQSSPVLGNGFGSLVTYKSSDPRVLEKNPSGEYTTFAFEWGWLDIWLKIGLLGAATYLLTLFLIIKNGLKSQSAIHRGVVIGLFVLMVINFFSPYLNHPLGIGFLVISGLLGETQ